MDDTSALHMLSDLSGKFNFNPLDVEKFRLSLLGSLGLDPSALSLPQPTGVMPLPGPSAGPDLQFTPMDLDDIPPSASTVTIPASDILPSSSNDKTQVPQPAIASTTSPRPNTPQTNRSGSARVLVVSEVKSKADIAKARLRAELDKVERELWALDVEKEVLITVKEKADLGNSLGDMMPQGT